MFDVEQSVSYAKKEMVKTSDAIPLKDAVAIDSIPDRAEKTARCPQCQRTTGHGT